MKNPRTIDNFLISSRYMTSRSPESRSRSKDSKNHLYKGRPYTKLTTECLNNSLNHNLRQEIRFLKNSINKYPNDFGKVNFTPHHLSHSKRLSIDSRDNTFISSPKERNSDFPDSNFYYIDYTETEKLKQENVTLKADNMIYREDINHLTEVNKNLENQLSLIRKKK